MEAFWSVSQRDSHSYVGYLEETSKQPTTDKEQNGDKSKKGPVWDPNHTICKSSLKGRWYKGLQGKDLLLLLWRAQGWTLGYPQAWVLQIQEKRFQWQEEKFQERLKRGQVCCSWPGQVLSISMLVQSAGPDPETIDTSLMIAIAPDSDDSSQEWLKVHFLLNIWSELCSVGMKFAMLLVLFLAGKGQGEGVKGRQGPKQVQDLSFMCMWTSR